MKYNKLIILFVLTILVVIVVLQNTETVETEILFATVSLPRAYLLVGTSFAGFLLGYFAAVMRRKNGGG